MAKQKMIRVILKHPNEKYGHAVEIPNTLKALQEAVEGHIETYPIIVPATGKEAVFILNEEGRLNKDPQCNLPFFGTVLVVGVDGEEFCDCPFSMRFWEKLVRGEL